jgi:hypothetical protein
MCPACIAAVISVAAGAVWTGTLTALVVRDVHEERRGQ